VLAARLGFEPRYSDSESEVLPLDDLAIYTPITNKSGIPLYYNPNFITFEAIASKKPVLKGILVG
jgi:hypothetical protein